MSRFRVVLDANVLFPIVQADLLLQLASKYLRPVMEFRNFR